MRAAQSQQQKPRLEPSAPQGGDSGGTGPVVPPGLGMVGGKMVASRFTYTAFNGNVPFPPASNTGDRSQSWEQHPGLCQPRVSARSSYHVAVVADSEDGEVSVLLPICSGCYTACPSCCLSRQQRSTGITVLRIFTVLLPVSISGFIKVLG